MGSVTHWGVSWNTYDAFERQKSVTKWCNGVCTTVVSHIVFKSYSGIIEKREDLKKIYEVFKEQISMNYSRSSVYFIQHRERNYLPDSISTLHIWEHCFMQKNQEWGEGKGLLSGI